MANRLSGKIRGWEELKKTLDNMAKIIGDQEVIEAVFGIAKDAAGEIRARAPMGKTGRLKRSIRARKFARVGQLIAFAAVDRKIAPHAHLVENGHRTRSGTHVPGRPFFKPVINTYRNGKYLKRVAKVLEAKIKKVRPIRAV